MKAKMELKKILPTLGFREVEDGYEYTNKKYTIFLQDSNKISIISDIEDDEAGYLSVPSLNIMSKEFLIKSLRAMEVL